MERFGSLIKRRRRSLTVSAYFTGLQSKPTQSTRGKITGWNDGTAFRLQSFIESFRQDFTVMVTLTYPAKYPKSGKAVKANLKAFTERVRRTGWLEENSFVWFMEFQARGAPHFHLLATGFISKNFVSEAWAEITGGDRASCSRCEAIRNPDSAGAYAKKYATKSEQKEVPKDFEDVGRFWGCCGPRIWRGMTRCPSVVAAAPETLPSDMQGLFDAILTRTQVRAKLNERGITFWGKESEVTEAWHYLLDHIAVIDPSEKLRASSGPPTAVGW